MNSKYFCPLCNRKKDPRSKFCQKCYRSPLFAEKRSAITRNANLGRHPSDEIKKKISESKKGWRPSKEHIEHLKRIGFGSKYIPPEKLKEWREKAARKTSGDKHPLWKGDNVGIKALHLWVRCHKPKSPVCEMCSQKKRLDLANIRQEYKRDFSDWEWLCRKCHMIKDGRLSRFVELRKQRINA
jgi:hypothetical protein